MLTFRTRVPGDNATALYAYRRAGAAPFLETKRREMSVPATSGNR